MDKEQYKVTVKTFDDKVLLKKNGDKNTLKKVLEDMFKYKL